ncbi:MAG: four helix bundle protein [Deltaproteobacteria bacterium]|nr:four helix bundle protein [Deltaproteobacteria bacterium]
MLEIYSVCLAVARDSAEIAKKIERGDPDLARQLRRAATSIVLNLAEGTSSQGGIKKARYYTALGSARETGACIDVAVATQLIDRPDPDTLDRLDHVQRTLARLVG